MNRTLTVLILPADHPDEIDAMSFADRRANCGGRTRIEVLHPGDPDVLVRKALDLDMGVYSAPLDHDRDDDNCTVNTSLITGDHLEYAAGLLTPLLSNPLALAHRLIAYARTQEDPEHVARVLAQPSTTPALGRAEEAAAYIRIFCSDVSFALETAMGIAWEIRTYASERPIVMLKDVMKVLPHGWEEVPLNDARELETKLVRSGDDTMRLVQNPESVTITIAESIVRHEIEIRTLLALRSINDWIAQAVAHTSSLRAALGNAPAPVETGFTSREIDQILASIRAGDRVSVGGSRSRVTYRCNAGETDFIAEDFEDGYTADRPCSEGDLRAIIAHNPDSFLEVLRRPLLTRLQATLLANESNDVARAHLRELLVYGDCLNHRHLLEAVLDWPSARPTAETVARIAKTDGLDVFHAIRSAIGYGTTSVEAGQFGVRFYSALEAIANSSEMPRWRRYRAEFRGLAGDTNGAIEDLEWERARLAPDHGDDIEIIDRDIKKLRQQTS